MIKAPPMIYDFTELTISQIYSVFKNMGYESTIDPKPGESDFVVALRAELPRKIFTIMDEIESAAAGQGYMLSTTAQGGLSRDKLTALVIS